MVGVNDGSNENIHEVDVRNNNDGYWTAFVYDIWVPYPLRIDPADSTRKTILYHDITTHENKDVRLVPQ